MKIIITIGIFIAFFQFLLLQNKKGKSLPDKVLSFWMLVIAFHLLSYYLHLNGYWIKYPHLIGLTVPFPLFYGPLLYLYTAYSIKKDNHLNKKDYIHYLPIALSYLYMSKFYFFYSADEKKLVDSGQIHDFDTFTNLLLLAFIISGISYTVLSLKHIRKYKQLININFSNDEEINLRWLHYFIFGLGIIFFTAILIIITRDFLGFNYSFNLDFIFYSMLIFAIISLGYFGIRHKNIFVDNVIIGIQDNFTKSSYKNSGLKDDFANKKHAELLTLMERGKPYLEPKLTLSNLANLLEISPNYLSQIINQFENQNFNDFVNKYRIQEFIERASSNNQFSLLGHAFDSGFNSKSTFNSVFKKQKGCTPSQYLSNVAHKK